MSDYISSALLAFQTKITDDYTKFETRELSIPILGKALKYAPYVVDDLNAIRQSSKRTVDTYYMKRITATNGTSRVTSPTGTQGDSAQIALSWQTFSEPFGIFSSTGKDNVFDDKTMLINQIKQAQRNLRERIGATIVAALYTAKTAASYTEGLGAGTTQNAVWNGTNGAFENSGDQSGFIFENAASVMRQNKYQADLLDVIADPKTFKQATFLRAQGQGNYQNLSYQFTQYAPDGIMEHQSLVSEVATAYPGGAMLVMPENAFALIPWIPQINRDGYGEVEDFVGMFGQVPDESGLNLTYAVRAWTQRADGSANGGVAQDVQTQMELSVDIAIPIAPISNSGETPIYLFGQLT